MRPLAYEGIEVYSDPPCLDILNVYFRFGIQLSQAALSLVLCIGCDMEGKLQHDKDALCMVAYILIVVSSSSLLYSNDQELGTYRLAFSWSKKIGSRP